jgi:L-aspartate oxidase
MANYLETDVLIIGCGIAGGVTALQLADSGIPVTLITRSKQAEESNTFYAQGGIIYKAKKDRGWSRKSCWKN